VSGGNFLALVRGFGRALRGPTATSLHPVICGLKQNGSLRRVWSLAWIIHLNIKAIKAMSNNSW